LDSAGADAKAAYAADVTGAAAESRPTATEWSTRSFDRSFTHAAATASRASSARKFGTYHTRAAGSACGAAGSTATKVCGADVEGEEEEEEDPEDPEVPSSEGEEDAGATTRRRRRGVAPRGAAGFEAPRRARPRRGARSTRPDVCAAIIERDARVAKWRGGTTNNAWYLGLRFPSSPAVIAEVGRRRRRVRVHRSSATARRAPDAPFARLTRRTPRTSRSRGPHARSSARDQVRVLAARPDGRRGF
jgi:hypothetical protein